MNFGGTSVASLLPQDITVIDRAFLERIKVRRRIEVADWSTNRQQMPQSASADLLNQIIDNIGVASAKAQGLKQEVTSTRRLLESDHRLYLQHDGHDVIGILKVGLKTLFIIDPRETIQEIRPLCVLDFYVHESRQRSGKGKALFEFMLQKEQVRPEMLAYDRPSPKLLPFLNKHYNLQTFRPQPNNFVVFVQYFRYLDLEACSVAPRTSRRYVSPVSSTNPIIPRDLDDSLDETPPSPPPPRRRSQSRNDLDEERPCSSNLSRSGTRFQSNPDLSTLTMADVLQGRANPSRYDYRNGVSPNSRFKSPSNLTGTSLSPLDLGSHSFEQTIGDPSIEVCRPPVDKTGIDRDVQPQSQPIMMKFRSRRSSTSSSPAPITENGVAELSTSAPVSQLPSHYLSDRVRNKDQTGKNSTAASTPIPVASKSDPRNRSSTGLVIPPYALHACE